ncbi:MAG: enoyl-CoA hydratase/isomerase family protein [Pirellulales bacterium]
MESALIQLEERADGVVIVTLDRPAKRNALHVALMESLCAAMDRLAGNATCRVVIVQGAGPVFCAGLDLTEAAQPDFAEQSAEAVARMLRTVADSPLVTIAVAHGAALAGGAGLMAACDFVVATEDLRIGFPEVRRGLVPALVSTVLRQRVQESSLRELLILANEIDAPRALQMGLIDRIARPGELLDVAHAIATQILMAAPNAVRLTKQLLLETRELPQGDALRLALDFHSQARGSDEAREGLAAFAERRSPNW